MILSLCNLEAASVV